MVMVIYFCYICRFNHVCSFLCQSVRPLSQLNISIVFENAAWRMVGVKLVGSLSFW